MLLLRPQVLFARRGSLVQPHLSSRSVVFPLLRARRSFCSSPPRLSASVTVSRAILFSGAGSVAAYSTAATLLSTPVKCENYASAPARAVQQQKAADCLVQEHCSRNPVISFLRSLLRSLYLCAIFGPLLIAWPLYRRLGYTDLWWQWCVQSFESSGALLIKLAQWSSSRPDLFGAHSCKRFEHLQDATRPHAWHHTVDSLDRMFGPGWREDLRLEPTPIGSGCIAQVYRGQLRCSAGNKRGGTGTGTGTGASGSGGGGGAAEEWMPVAVKVVHPHVAERIAVDMDLLCGAGWLLERLPKVRWLNPTGMISEFAGLLLKQLDLSIEAKNLETFLRHFPRETYHGVLDFPEPQRPYVSRDVLVETFIDGQAFLDWGKSPRVSEEEHQRVCGQGIDAVIKMIFIDNFVHGDLHPGNILVTKDGCLGFLDAGIAVSYSDAVHEHLIDVLSAFIRYDGYEGGRLMAERSTAEAADQTRVRGAPVRDLDAFCVKIQKMVEMARDEPSFFDKLGECITIICQAACDHHVKMQSGFISIALSVKIVEGALLQVDPLCVVAPRAKAVVLREHLRRRLAGGGQRRAEDEAEVAEAERKLEEELQAVDRQKRAEQQQRLLASGRRMSDWSGSASGKEGRGGRS